MTINGVVQVPGTSQVSGPLLALHALHVHCLERMPPKAAWWAAGGGLAMDAAPSQRQRRQADGQRQRSCATQASARGRYAKRCGDVLNRLSSLSLTYCHNVQLMPCHHPAHCSQARRACTYLCLRKTKPAVRCRQRRPTTPSGASSHVLAMNRPHFRVLLHSANATRPSSRSRHCRWRWSRRVVFVAVLAALPFSLHCPFRCIALLVASISSSSLPAPLFASPAPHGTHGPILRTP
jgi:hypothetical protein